jgi:hypothetical protein
MEKAGRRGIMVSIIYLSRVLCLCVCHNLLRNAQDILLVLVIKISY